jgi:hypothetical protein
MEEPFLSALIADETEAAIANEPLDCALWHNGAPYVYNKAKFRHLRQYCGSIRGVQCFVSKIGQNLD